LRIGSTDLFYGGGTDWNDGYGAGLLLETLANPEVVHDKGWLALGDET
jgi:hypothetical protein